MRVFLLLSVRVTSARATVKSVLLLFLDVFERFYLSLSLSLSLFVSLFCVRVYISDIYFVRKIPVSLVCVSVVFFREKRRAAEEARDDKRGERGQEEEHVMCEQMMRELPFFFSSFSNFASLFNSSH